VDKWRDCRLFVDMMKQVKLSQITARNVGSNLLHCQSESVVIVENIPETH
jgi:hypothetical protein